MTSLNPVQRVGDQIVEQIQAHRDLGEAEARDAGRRAARPRGHPARGRARALLPPRVLGRHAPARDDRDGVLLRARRPDRRRAHHRARRDHPGADPRADRRDARGGQRRRDPRDPRPRRGGRHRRPDRRDVRAARSWSRARSTSSSTTPSTPTRGGCSDRSPASTATGPGGSRPSAGLPPSLADPPEGCRFRPRCPHAFDACRQLPALEHRGGRSPEHLDRCFLSAEQKRERARGRRPGGSREPRAPRRERQRPPAAAARCEHLKQYFPVKAGRGVRPRGGARARRGRRLVRARRGRRRSGWWASRAAGRPRSRAR